MICPEALAEAVPPFGQFVPLVASAPLPGRHDATTGSSLLSTS